MKLIYCGLLLLCPYMSRAVDVLSIGDEVPKALLQNTITSNGSSLADIKKQKWLILDFMASSCVSCIKLLPAFNSLQQQYAADLEIVLVTVQPLQKMQAFLQKNPALDFSVVGNDTLLEQYFPHQTISHLVWINPAGIVKAITSGYYLTEKTFARAKTNEPLYWPVKQDGKPYDYHQALLTYNPLNLQESFTESPLYYTAVRPALPGVQPFARTIADTTASVKRYSFINQSLPQMVAKMMDRPTMPASYFIVNSAQRAGFFSQYDSLLKDDWKLKNHHCVEMQLPLDASVTRARQMFNTCLQQYFGVQASLDTVERAVTIVAGKFSYTGKIPTGYSLQSLASVIYNLNKKAGIPPVMAIPGTAVKQKIPMPLPGSMDAKAILHLLEAYGYQVYNTVHPLESIIISDN
jgi:thiol-disulfide isomerase/thioredoxin